ncbi:MAG: hypothetical protein JWL64_2664, partial [Frankiales bacterium]|nr:hypothetical protein [Frankiales bacterium]
MLPVPDRLPLLCRKPRKAASVTVLALALGGAGGLVLALPASAAASGAVPTYTVTPLPALNNPNALRPVLARVNADSYLDIVTSGSNGFTVELNNGNGTFAAPVVTSSPGSYALAVGDVDLDGTADVVTARYGTITVNLGDGSGGFSPAPVATTATSSTSYYITPVLGDFDGNGLPDLAIVGQNGTVGLYSGTGAGSFTYVASAPTGSSNNALSADGADINGDGRTDLVLPNYSYNTTTVLLSNGTAFGFAAPQQYAVGGLSTSLADFNGDGHPDIAFGGSTAGALIYNPVTTTFTTMPAPGSGPSQGVTAADLNGDGLVDLAVGQNPNETIYLNDGAGGFVKSPLTFPYSGYSYAQAAGDLNNDGRIDLVATMYPNNNVVFLNTGNAAPATITDQPNNQTIASGNTATFVSAATSNTPQTVQWQLSTDGGTTYANIAGATAASYTTPLRTTANSGYRYRAVYTNYGGVVQTSAATLTVTATVPTATTDPQSQTVNSGQTATFTATATGDPTPTVRWQVSTNGGASYANISGATSTSYTTPVVTRTQNGNLYRAVFTNSAGTDTTAAAFLGVNATAPVVSSNPGNRTVTSGATATFSAAATGDPTPTVQWQVSTDGGTNYADISGATATTYAVATTYADRGNRYRAVFTNSAGVATTTAATLTVQAATPVVTDNPADQAVGSGGTATFTAAATGDPTPTVQWQVSTDGGATFGNLAGATGPTLSV